MLNNKIQTNVLLIPAAALLAACGGGGELTNSERATQLLNAADETLTNFVDGQDRTLLADIDELTFDGPVQYSGALAVSAGEGAPGEGEVLVAYLGELELEADFDLGTISGNATNFMVIENPDVATDRDLDADLVAGGDVTGILTIAGTQSVGIEVFYNVTLDGDLTADTSDLSFNETPGEVAVFGANAEALIISGEVGATFNDNPGFFAFDGVAAR